MLFRSLSQSILENLLLFNVLSTIPTGTKASRCGERPSRVDWLRGGQWAEPRWGPAPEGRRAGMEGAGVTHPARARQPRPRELLSETSGEPTTPVSEV